MVERKRKYLNQNTKKHVWKHIFGDVDDTISDPDISLTLWYHFDPEIQHGCHPVKDGCHLVERKLNFWTRSENVGFLSLHLYSM